MSQKSSLKTVVAILLIIGALNWGLVGLGMLISQADWNVVTMLFRQWPTLQSIVYVLVGLAGVYKLVMFGRCGGCCSGQGATSGSCCQ